MRILVAEDERDLNDLICRNLKQAHYSVDAVYNGEDALYYVQQAEYDALILDIMMPKVDGIRVLTQLRKQQNMIPVLLLTARDSIEDRVKGLDAGADDYLVKPFALEELLARLRVMLRKPIVSKTNTLKIADLIIYQDTRQVFRNKKEIHLSSKEYALLYYMIQNKGIVLSRETLEQHIGNFDYTASSNVIDVYIRYLRKKIDEPYEIKLIHTVRGHGYVLKEPS